MVSEEFSFPKIISNNPLSYFAVSSSPSLWRVTSVVYPADFSDHLDDEDYINNGRSEAASAEFKNFKIKDNKEGLCYKSKGDQMMMIINTSSSDDRQEKMDLLWEHFDEDPQRVSSINANNKQLSAIDSCDCHEDDLQLSCVEPLNKKPAAAVLYQPKKQSLVLVVKILKKIFLLHKSAQIKKN